MDYAGLSGAASLAMDTPSLQGRKVLIVDDDEDVLGSIDLAMRAEGAETKTVADGNAAVSACQHAPPDAVVLDMMLPKRSGFLVLEKIKANPDAPIVVMITANRASGIWPTRTRSAWTLISSSRSP